MSKIKKELTELTEVNEKRGEDQQDFLNRLVKGVNALSDKDFNALSSAAAKWVNSAFDALEAKPKKPLPNFPDAEDAEDTGTRRRRGAAEEEPETAAEPKKGDTVEFTTKRGKVVKGEVTEIDDEQITVKGDDGEDDYPRSRIDGDIKVIGAKKADKKSDDDEDDDPIKVGAEVTVVTKRGRETTGKITELDEDVVVLKTADGEKEIDRDTVAEIKPVGKKATAKKDEEAPSGRRSSRSADKGDDEGEGKTSKRSSGVGTVARELLAAHFADTGEVLEKEAYLKKVKKEVEGANDSTLNIAHADFERMIELLRKHKVIK